MRFTAVFGVVLGAAALVTAGPILRSGAVEGLASSETNSLAKRGFMDDMLEGFFATLNYPDDMTKRSTDLKALSVSDRRVILEAAALANMDAFTAYIDNMDDEAVHKALSDPELSSSMYEGPKDVSDMKIDDEMDLGLFTLLPGSESNKYHSASTDLNTDIQTGRAVGISKRDFGDWAHNKCRFKAGFHREMDRYYCYCLRENIYVDDLFPECCKKILGDLMAPGNRVVDDGHDDSVDHD